MYFSFFVRLINSSISGQLTASHIGAGLNTKGNQPGIKGTGFTVKALYDYTAADKDEVGSISILVVLVSVIVSLPK